MFKIVEDKEFKDLLYNHYEPIYPNYIVLELKGTIFPNPTKTSIQIGTGRYIEDTLGKYINHSCTPNCKIMDNYVVAIKIIKKGDRITFDYNKTEDKLTNPLYLQPL